MPQVGRGLKRQRNRFGAYPSTNVGRTHRLTSGVVSVVLVSRKKSIRSRGTSRHTTFNGGARWTASFIWMDVRTRPPGRRTRGQVFRPANGSEILWLSRRHTLKMDISSAAVLRPVTCLR